MAIIGTAAILTNMFVHERITMESKSHLYYTLYIICSFVILYSIPIAISNSNKL